MRIAGDLVEGHLVRRDNRFRVTAEVGGREVWAHLPNSGRLGELLLPGRRVVLVERAAPGRKTGYDLSLVEHEGRWVSVDARLPNDLVEEALLAGRLEPLAGYPAMRREVTRGRSRFDFLLEAPGRRPCLVEVKSITLVVDGLGCFPDAVTLRGRVVDENAAALRFAVVQIESLQRGTVTDAAGGFEFPNLSTGEYVLRASMLGYEAAEETVSISEDAGEPVVKTPA